VADANMSAQKGDLGIVEDLRDQAHGPVGANGFAIMH
jgi:hypothetical protein